MQLIEKSNANIFSASPSTTIFEFPITSEVLAGAVANINGRYPEKGRVVNEISEELVCVVDGSGKITSGDQVREFTRGDVLLIEAGEEYFWEGDNLSIFMATSPPWTPEQHKFIE